VAASSAASSGRVQWGTTTITYALRWSAARRKTVSIAVEPRGSVVVTAPRGTPERRISEVVRSRARWIVGRVKSTSDLPPALPAREFVTGETFLYLGRQYRLKLVDRAPVRPSPSGGAGWSCRSPGPSGRSGGLGTPEPLSSTGTEGGLQSGSPGS